MTLKKKKNPPWVPEVERNKEADRYLASLNVTARYPKDGHLNNTNQHPCQAAERSLATARALAFLYGNGIRKVTSVYGNSRDESIVSFCNAKVPQNDKLELTRYSPAITAKDFSRKPTSITYGDAVREAQALLLVDVYETDMRPTGPFSPNIIADMVTPMGNFVGGNRLVWVGRCFYGDADLVCNEGGWFRSENGKIVFRSSQLEPQEYQHDPCDWLWKQQSATIRVHGQNFVLSWSIVRVIGTFKIVSFNITPGDLEATSPKEIYPYAENFVTVKCYKSSTNTLSNWFLTTCMDYIPGVSSLSRHWSPFFQEKKLFGPIYQAARGVVNQKRYTQTNFDRVATALQVAHQEPRVELFLKLFPQFRISPKDYSGLAWGILTDDIEERQINLRFAQRLDAHNMASVNEMQSQIGAPPSPSSSITKKVIIGSAAAAGVLLVLWKGYRCFRPVRVAVQAVRADWTINWPFNMFLYDMPVKTDNLVVAAVSGVAITGFIVPVTKFSA